MKLLTSLMQRVEGLRDENRGGMKIDSIERQS